MTEPDMLKFLWSNRIAHAFLVMILVVGVVPLRASEEKGFVTPFLPSDDVMADVDKTLAAAAEGGKLALIVMGGTWCHDSRGLVKRFRDEAIAPVLDANYELLYVDVGHMEGARSVNERFGMPAIYATPTVMIVDPEIGMLTNARTMHKWRDAYSISYEDTRTYFEAEALAARVPAAPVSEHLQAYYDQINAFEKEQASRLLLGYDLISPQLAMGSGNYPDGFEVLWGEVRDFRYKMTDDLLALRAKAEALDAVGMIEPLIFPAYPALSWEKVE
jgi:hypothetical protein